MWSVERGVLPRCAFPEANSAANRRQPVRGSPIPNLRQDVSFFHRPCTLNRCRESILYLSASSLSVLFGSFTSVETSVDRIEEFCFAVIIVASLVYSGPVLGTHSTSTVATYRHVNSTILTISKTIQTFIAARIDSELKKISLEAPCGLQTTNAG